MRLNRVLRLLCLAALILLLLSRTKDIYRLSWRDLRLNRNIIRRIFRIGLPAAVSSIITSVSNVFVQSYVNFFGSDCMAGWSCYNKIDTFIYLPMSSMATAATTFVSQNIGAGKTDRVEKGTFQAVGVTVALTAGIAALHAEKNDVLMLHKTVLDMLGAVNWKERMMADRDFHYRLALITKNPLILRTYDLMWDVLRANMIENSEKTKKEKAVSYHSQIITAIADHNEEEASRLMREHLTKGLQ